MIQLREDLAGTVDPMGARAGSHRATRSLVGREQGQG
jgi:hypothetical protein